MRFVLIVSILISFHQSSFAKDELNSSPLCSDPQKGISIDLDGVKKIEKANQAKVYCESYQKCFPSGLVTDMKKVIKTCIKRLTSSPDKCGGLTAAELESIKEYTSSGYGSINRSIWKEKKTCEGVISTLNQALLKVPNFQGWVLRGTDLPKKIRDQHIKNKTITYKAFTSTSTQRGWGGQDQFLIYSINGASVANISSHKTENEVLFTTETQFKVIEKIETSKGVNLYIMIENDPELGEEENLKRQLAIYKQEKSKIKKIKKVIKKSSKSYFFNNIFNNEIFQSNNEWKCSDGISHKDIKG